METLLNKVKKFEEEAKNVIAKAKHTGTENMRVLLASEKRQLEEATGKAQTQGDALKNETLTATKQELNSLHQEERLAVESIHATAKKNRTAAVARVLELFKQSYRA